MIGRILAFSRDVSAGLIQSRDNQLYLYSLNEYPLFVEDQEVTFEVKGGWAHQIKNLSEPALENGFSYKTVLQN